MGIILFYSEFGRPQNSSIRGITPHAMDRLVGKRRQNEQHPPGYNVLNFAAGGAFVGNKRFGSVTNTPFSAMCMSSAFPRSSELDMCFPVTADGRPNLSEKYTKLGRIRAPRFH